MISLSVEQLRKIEENKAAALLKKQQAIQKLKAGSVEPNLKSNIYVKKQNWVKCKKPPDDSYNKNRAPSVTAVFKVFGEDRFVVDMPYHVASIEIFKTIPGRKYDSVLRKWNFPLSEQSNVASKLKNLHEDILVNAIPDPVVKVLLEEAPPEADQIDWSRIDKVLRDYLLPFQVEGVRFGVKKKGRCLIADDMGLGKTIQALGIAHYFKENWPLLIVCPSSMRFPWQEAIKTFLPSVDSTITVLTTGKGQAIDGEIVISSYDLMKSCFEDLIKRKFGVIIFDESHSLKSSKTARTKAALEIASLSRNLILLSGTPALSRPQELYSQIYMIDPYTFKTFYEFGIRYCDGKKDRFGWNFYGSSNLEELELYLRKKLMIRRLKSEVIKQLPSKIRKLVVLDPTMVKNVSKKMKKLELEFSKQNGSEKHSTLLTYYSVTGNAKLNAVCEYLEDKLENQNKFLVFAHHLNVLNGICDLLENKRVDYIRIDGSVSSEARKELCDKFQNDSQCRVAVLSLKAANCGITLTAAQLVVFAELYWNPGELTQAEDRAHRIGQQDSVLVEYLVAKGTADEHLWTLIQTKLNILNQAGLSKDCFKNADTEHMANRCQPTITSMLTKTAEDVEMENRQIRDDFLVEMDDDILANINLEEIETEYQISSKKRKTNL